MTHVQKMGILCYHADMKKEKKISVIDECTCDKCGRKIEVGELRTEVETKNFPYQKNSVDNLPIAGSTKKRDLCWDCSQELELCLKSKPKSVVSTPVSIPSVTAKCVYDRSWAGRCNKPTTNGAEFCKEHLGEKCFNCKKQATRECDFCGQFVCGIPMCDRCRHVH